MIFPWWFTENIVSKLLSVLASQKDSDFIIHQYLPNLKPMMEKISVSCYDKILLLDNFISLIMKIFYSFIWEEKNPIT